MTGDFGATAASVWDVSISGDAEVANLPAVANAYGAVAFTADGSRLVASSTAGSVTVWDALTFRPVRTIDGTASPPSPGGTADPAVASGADVFSLDVSPDGRLVAAARFDGSIRVWDVRTGRDAFTVDPGPTQAPYMDVTWSPAGDFLAVSANDGFTGRVTVVDRSGRRVTVLQEKFGFAVGGVAFSPDGEELVTTRLPTASPDPDAARVVIWDWEAEKIERTIATEATGVAHSPTGHLIATVSRGQGPVPGGSVDVWDSATGRHVATLAGSKGVIRLAFSADGSRLATTGHDGTVRLWDPSSGDQLLVLHGHDGMVTSVAFSPDGERLASVGEDGKVRVWALDLNDLLRIAEREIRRPLTDEECRQYLHVPDCREPRRRALAPSGHRVPQAMSSPPIVPSVLTVTRKKDATSSRPASDGGLISPLRTQADAPTVPAWLALCGTSSTTAGTSRPSPTTVPMR